MGDKELLGWLIFLVVAGISWGLIAGRLIWGH